MSLLFLWLFLWLWLWLWLFLFPNIYLLFPDWLFSWLVGLILLFVICCLYTVWCYHPLPLPLSQSLLLLLLLPFPLSGCYAAVSAVDDSPLLVLTFAYSKFFSSMIHLQYLDTFRYCNTTIPYHSLSKESKQTCLWCVCSTVALFIFIIIGLELAMGCNAMQCRYSLISYCIVS